MFVAEANKQLLVMSADASPLLTNNGSVLFVEGVKEMWSPKIKMNLVFCTIMLTWLG